LFSRWVEIEIVERSLGARRFFIFFIIVVFLEFGRIIIFRFIGNHLIGLLITINALAHIF
jgi:uncharacterized membrane protein